tara:strand:+ start:176 stop:1546 length:1371 start_codon:yes stop_codon:yes gene_type:complete
MTKARTIADLGTGFVNISDTGTEGTKVASGTTAQRGSTTGQIRFNSTTGLAEYYNGSSFINIEGTPVVSSISPNNIDTDTNALPQNITITGTGFQSGASVAFIGTDAVSVNSPTVTFTNTTTLVAQVPSSVDTTKQPFDIKVTNPTGLIATLADGLQLAASPAWTTSSGSLGNIGDTTSANLSVVATDPDGGAITYSETTSNVLGGAGLSLNTSTGAITGNPNDVTSDTTINFTIRATDNESDTTDRNFAITIQKAIDGSSSSRAAASANAIKTINPSASNGVYWINLTSGAKQVYCDFDGTYSGDSSNAYMLYQSFGNNNTTLANAINTAGLSTVSAMQSAGWSFQEASGGQSQFGAGADKINYWRNSQNTAWLRLNTLSLDGLSGINKIAVKWGSDYASDQINLKINNSQVAAGDGSGGDIFSGTYNPSGSTPHIELYESYGINTIYYIFLTNT